MLANSAIFRIHVQEIEASTLKTLFFFPLNSRTAVVKTKLRDLWTFEKTLFESRDHVVLSVDCSWHM